MDWSPEKFKVLSDFVLGEFAKEGKLDTAVNAKIEELKGISDYYKNLNAAKLREAALEEVVAEACQRMLTESDAVQRLAELHKKDSGLFHKVKSFIANFFNRVVQRYKNLTPQGLEAKLVDSIPDMAERMKMLFSDALVIAAENQRVVGEKTGVAAKFQAEKVDNRNGAWDNVSRANKEGDLINEFHGALTREQWRQFYNNLAEDGWLQETEVGTVAPIRVGNKIIVAEREMRGKDAHDFIVDDVYLISNSDEEIVTETIESLSKYITKWRDLYGSDEIYRKSIQLCRFIDGDTILRRYDINNNRFVDDNSKGQSNEDVGDVFKGSREEVTGEGISSGNQQDIQTDEGLRPTKFQHKSLDALSDEELLARHLEENSEAVGEILRRTADIEINPRVLNLLVNKKLKEYGISKDGREQVASVVPLLMDSAKSAAVKGGDITADLTSAIAEAIRNTEYTENLHAEDKAAVVEALKGFKGRVYLNEAQAIDVI